MMAGLLCRVGVLFLLVGAVAGVGPTRATASSIEYFSQTGHTLELGFAEFVAAHGGVAVTGYPITEEIDEDGRTVQYFQHIRLEWHPDLPPGSQIVVGALGLELGKTRPPSPGPPSGAGTLRFLATGHDLGGGFLRFYQTHAGSLLLGAPITQELSEGGYTVQYFTKAELTWRPGAGVTLGSLGLEAAQQRGWTSATPPLAPVPAPHQATRPASSTASGASGSADSVLAASMLIGARGANAPASSAVGGIGRVAVPVLAYHHIGDWPSVYTVSAAHFAAELAWLQANGYTGVTLRTVVDALVSPVPLPPKPVVITIDDGYADAATTARQVLERFHMPATFFIPTWQTSLTPATLRAMDAEGFDIEAHSRTHPDLTTLDDQAAWSQIAGSKADLERILGHPVELFAYPYGAVNARISSLVARAGYRAGILATYGFIYSATTPFYEPRVLVDRGDDLSNFVAKVLGQPYKNTINLPPNGNVGPSPANESPAPTYSSSSGAGSGDGSSGSGDGGTDTSDPGGHGALYD